MMHVRRRLAATGTVLAAAVAVSLGSAGAGSAAAPAVGQPGSALNQEIPSTGRTPAVAGAQKTASSANWAGYVKAGSYHAVSGTWTVPSVTMHGSQDGFSSNWVGIGGCGSPCGTDQTLIQAGTEQEVTASGGKVYYAWWELIPATEQQVGMTVRPGDTVSVSIAETPVNSNSWKIVIRNVTRGATVTKTVHYVSHHRSVEWVEEAVTLYYPGAQAFRSLPNVSKTTFRQLGANGAAANIASGATKITMTGLNSSNTAIVRLATASAPKTGGTSFSVCSYQSSCP